MLMVVHVYWGKAKEPQDHCM